MITGLLRKPESYLGSSPKYRDSGTSASLELSRV